MGRRELVRLRVVARKCLRRTRCYPSLTILDYLDALAVLHHLFALAVLHYLFALAVLHYLFALAVLHYWAAPPPLGVTFDKLGSKDKVEQEYVSGASDRQ